MNKLSTCKELITWVFYATLNTPSHVQCKRYKPKGSQSIMHETSIDKCETRI